VEWCARRDVDFLRISKIFAEGAGKMRLAQHFLRAIMHKTTREKSTSRSGVPTAVSTFQQLSRFDFEHIRKLSNNV
jgi:hypothetical protein